MKPELRRVLDKATECLEDAKYLYKGERYEAAVNRSYYSMFTAISGLLLAKDVFAKTHAGAKAKFHELYLKTNLLPLELGEIFETAFTLRQDADYDFEIGVSEEDAKQSIDDGEKFLSAVFSFLEKE